MPPGWFLLLVSHLVAATVVLTCTAQECGIARAFANHRQARQEHHQHHREPGSSRVVGGQPSPEGAWPWLVSLQLLHPGLGFVAHLCGGVLVHESWVLTAAHCIRNERYELPLAPLWSAEFAGRRRVAVEEIVVHERYSGFNHDIALVKLTKPTSDAIPVCLPRSGQGFLGVRCVASGWSGRPDSAGLAYRLGPPERRQGAGPPGPRAHAQLSVMESSACRALYAAKYNVTLGPGHLCAGSAGRGGHVAGTCLGDSGGPLQCNMGDGRWYLAGVTSFGSGCGRPGYPDVYSRLAFYLPWIREKIREFHNDV